MEGQIQAISRHMEGQETSDSDPHQGKLHNYLAFCTHPDVHDFEGHIWVYIHENRFKSRVWKIMHVFRDDLGNIKGTKIVNGVQRVSLLHFDQKSDGRIVGFSTLPCRMYDTMIFFKRRKLVVGICRSRRLSDT